MKNTKEIEFELEGVSPLKMDRWVDDQPNMKTTEEYKKAAVNKVYRNEKGNLAIPSTAIKAAMRLASSEIGKKTEAKKNRQSISAGVFFDGFSFLVNMPFPSFPLPSLPFLSFPFLSFPLLSVPFLSFPFLSFPVFSSPVHSSPLHSALSKKAKDLILCLFERNNLELSKPAFIFRPPVAKP